MAGAAVLGVKRGGLTDPEVPGESVAKVQRAAVKVRCCE